MTPARLTQCLESLRWTEHGLAQTLGCDISLVQAWASGEIEVPTGVAAWLDTLALAHEALPVPKTWRGKRA